MILKVSSLGEEGGFSLIELIVVMIILTVVVGGIVRVFTAGISASADEARRFQDEQDTRLAMDKLRLEIHSGCTISSPGTYNTWVSSVTIYFASDSCVAGSHTVTWCASGSGQRYKLYRQAGTSCAGATAHYADYLTNPDVFVYLPPNSHLVTSTSLGMGTSSSYILTQDGSSTLPRLHVDLTVDRSSTKPQDAFHLVDDIAFNNGPRSCAQGVSTC